MEGAMTEEEMQNAILEKDSELEKIKARAIELEEENKKLTERNEKLIEHNNKLFARVNQPDEQKQEEQSQEQQEQNLIDYMHDLMHKMN